MQPQTERNRQSHPYINQNIISIMNRLANLNLSDDEEPVHTVAYTTDKAKALDKQTLEVVPSKPPNLPKKPSQEEKTAYKKTMVTIKEIETHNKQLTKKKAENKGKVESFHDIPFQSTNSIDGLLKLGSRKCQDLVAI